jgi:hypothetical protein
MSDVTIELGGRLPLIDPETLTTTQRYLYPAPAAAEASGDRSHPSPKES